jgi:hypothetical protein
MLALGLFLDVFPSRRHGAGSPDPSVARPVARGGLGDVFFPPHSGEHSLDASEDFTGAELSFAVTGEGVAIDPATGRLTIATDRLVDGITVVVTATNAAGSATSRFRLTVAADPIAAAPVLVTAPTLAGAGTIGVPVALDPGAWSGTPTPEIAVAWLVGGLAIDGATGLSYAPQTADDGKSLAARQRHARRRHGRRRQRPADGRGGGSLRRRGAHVRREREGSRD